MIGSGTFFDGLTAARHPVAVALGADAIEIIEPSRGALAAWRFADIAPVATPDGILRIGQTTSKVAARLEIRDTEFASALLGRAKANGRSGLTDARTRTKVVALSMAAIASLLACGIWGIPAAADRIASHLPDAVEIHLGNAINGEVRRVLTKEAGKKPLECGTGPQQQAGTKAFSKLIGELERAAELPIPLHATVVHVPEVNAIALSGGHIYLYEDLLKKAKSVDEVAGVLAHEIGHVAHRDVTKALLRNGSMGILFGMIIGDFTGAGALMTVASTILQNADSREAEAAADEYGAQLVGKLGGDPQALGAILKRISGDAEGSIPHFMLDHPKSSERAAAIANIAKPAMAKPLLTPQEWAAFKTICS
jgi:Zn-dependent protease with chaperone function